jgi:hypothetical protein
MKTLEGKNNAQLASGWNDVVINFIFNPKFDGRLNVVIMGLPRLANDSNDDANMRISVTTMMLQTWLPMTALPVKIHDDKEDQEMSEKFHLCEEDEHTTWKIGMSKTLKSISLAQCSSIEQYKHNIIFM